MNFSKEQQHIIDTRDHSLLVSASAGSGKTAVLVERLSRMVMDDKTPLDRVLAVTFTEDAAREIKARLKLSLQKRKEELVEKKAGKEELDYLDQQLTLLETAQISTIHGFCLNLLSEFYYLLDLDYSMTRNVENGPLRDAALDKAYKEALDQLDPDRFRDLHLYFGALSKGKEDQVLKTQILKLIEQAQSKPDPKAWMESSYKAPFSDWFYRFFLDRIQALIDLMEQMIEIAKGIESYKKAYDEPYFLNLFYEKIQRLEACKKDLEKQDYPAFKKTFLSYLKQTHPFPSSVDKVSSRKEKERAAKFEGDIVQALYDLDEFDKKHQELAPLAKTFIELAILTQRTFARQKKREGFIDFSDMEQFASELLKHPEVRNQMKERFLAVMIDEYQDTNELQDEILNAVSRTDNIFRVGDIKQSIYRFRQAKPELMKKKIAGAGQDLEVVYLMENYRSAPALIDFNNEFYARLMNNGYLEDQFSEDDAARAGLKWEKDPIPVRFLFTEYGDPNQIVEGAEKMNLNTQKRVHRRYLYDLIAQDILKKVEQGAEYRDIAILSRKHALHGDLAQVLESYGIPSLSRIKKGFYTNQAIEVVLAALRAIQNPRDDISLMAFLCSKLGASSQKEILKALEANPGTGSLYEKLRTTPIIKPLKELSALRDLSPAKALQQLYNYKNYYYFYASKEDRTNLDLLLEKAASASESMNLEEFLDLTSLEAGLDKTGEAFSYSKESNVVRINTIHASKGLQYKIVYLLTGEENNDLDALSPVSIDSDLGISFAGLDDKRHFKFKNAAHLALQTKRFHENLAEQMRLLYVATTRAQEELILVDTIKGRDDYPGGFNTLNLLQNRGFTSWIFHAFQNQASPLIRFEVKDYNPKSIPEPVKKAKSEYVPLQVYQKPVLTFTNKIASQQEKNEWNKIILDINPHKERGTLFHEMAQSLGYPYQKEEVLSFSSDFGVPMQPQDLQEFLSLNKQEEFRDWMGKEHYFEYPYMVQMVEDGANEISHGFMDFVCFDKDAIHIVDFKTDNRPVSQLLNTYRSQLETYYKAMHAIFPEAKINTYLYSFRSGQLAKLNA